jgi:thiamine biosynthesis lipoprotein
MGTVFSFDIRRPLVDRAVLGHMVRWLDRVDATFSTYRSDSVVSRLDRGELSLVACPEAVREVLNRCADLYDRSDGFFDVRAGGHLDPSGFVKGWAVERVSRILLRAGSLNHCVNGGGEVRARGEAEPGRPWRLGIADPFDTTHCRAVVAARDMAMATSGTYERGGHVVNPHTGRPASGLASLTVLCRDAGTADGLATAGFARGRASFRWLERLDGAEAYGIEPDGASWSTSGFPGLLDAQRD